MTQPGTDQHERGFAVRTRIAKWADANNSGTEHLFFAVCLDDTVIGYCAFNKRDIG